MESSSNDGKLHFGFIAQDVDEIAPKEIYGFVGQDERGYLNIHYWEFIGPIVKAIQELNDKIEKLEKKLDGLPKT